MIITPPIKGTYGIFFSTKYMIATATIVAIIKGGIAAVRLFPLLLYMVKKINKGPKSVINFKNDLFTMRFLAHYKILIN